MTALNSRVAALEWIACTRVEPHSLAAAWLRLAHSQRGLRVPHILTMEEIVGRNTLALTFQHAAIACVRRLRVAPGCNRYLRTDSLFGPAAHSGRSVAAWPSARRHRIFRMLVIRQGMILALIGVVIGLAGAFALSRFLPSFLFEVKARDPLAFVVARLLLTAVALLAVWAPAERAVL
jgi:putative ABC transport system permease protein